MVYWRKLPVEPEMMVSHLVLKNPALRYGKYEWCPTLFQKTEKCNLALSPVESTFRKWRFFRSKSDSSNDTNSCLLLRGQPNFLKMVSHPVTLFDEDTILQNVRLIKPETMQRSCTAMRIIRGGELDSSIKSCRWHRTRTKLNSP